MAADSAVAGSEASAQCLLRYTHRRTFLSTQVRDAAGVVAERVETADETQHYATNTVSVQLEARCRSGKHTRTPPLRAGKPFRFPR
jgi:hypothetical protein